MAKNSKRNLSHQPFGSFKTQKDAEKHARTLNYSTKIVTVGGAPKKHNRAAKPSRFALQRV